MPRTYKPFYWVTPETELFMSRGYLEGETVQERVKAIGQHAEALLKEEALSPEAAQAFDGFADKFVDYMSRGWFSLATPVWANFGRNGLPVSCNNVFVDDSVESIVTKLAEVSVQTKHGAGTSAYLGKLRPRGTKISTGGESDGPTHFAFLFQSAVDTIAQGTTRRGACAVYAEVDSPDILEWLTMRAEGSPIQTLSFGVCISDSWMQQMLAGDKQKREVWLRILEKRSETGYPYLFFKDAANEGKPLVYKNLDMTIWSSNLCAEIMQPSSVDESFVCVLASMNLLHFNEWKNTDAVKILFYLLDAITTEYIRKTSSLKFMESVNKFARRHRALGLGVLGWHSYLQSNGIPFASEKARAITQEYSKFLDKETLTASHELATLCGEPELLKGYGLRNTTRLAIAPTTSSSFILGAVSPSTEPLVSNYYEKRLAKGAFIYKNPYLQETLERYGANNRAIWDSIKAQFGSVQHLDFLSDIEKETYKTWEELPQEELIQQAAIRQAYIDQGQSLNLMLPADTPARDLHRLHVMAWELGLKSLYYQRTPSSPIQKLAVYSVNCVACEA